MSISEDWDSYYEDDTAAGWNVTRVFTALWSDWTNGSGDLTEGGVVAESNWEFPIVGDELAGRPNLVVSHRNAVAISGSVLDCKVTVTYSTETTESRSQSADQIASWEEELDISDEETALQDWISTDGYYEKWSDFWEANGPKDKDGKTTVTDDNMIDWFVGSAKAVYTISGYASAQYIVRILQNINKINSDRFIESIASEKALVVPDLNDDVGEFDDTFKWRFAGCRRRRVKKASYQYTFLFKYDGDGWDTITVKDEDANGNAVLERKVPLKYYKTYVMRDLLAGMDNIEDDFWLGARN